jgi:hypothetical protein
MAIPSGRKFDSYEVVPQIGAGWMGDVYRERSSESHRGDQSSASKSVDDLRERRNSLALI